MPILDPGVRLRSLSLSTPAKINLTLAVSGRREDGFHDLRSVVIGVDHRDGVRCTSGVSDGISIDCNEPLIEAQTNLALIAARLLAERFGNAGNTRITLTKRIPIGAGLGGGSSDAAATLRACNELWGLGLENRVLAEIGAEIGSDVPLFFSLPAAVMSGRGERVEPITLRWSGWVLLVLPNVSISTRAVYEAWRGSDAADHDISIADLSACASARTLAPLLFNDLEPAVFRVCPRVRALRDVVQSRIGGAVRVSGSGSALFQLFDDYERAAAAASAIDQASCPGVATSVVRAPVSCGDPVHEEC